MRFLKQSTTVTIPIGPFYDATDGVTVESALTIPPSSVQISKNNGAMAAKDESSTATYDAAGIYRITLGGTVDVGTAGNLRIVANVSGAVGVFEDFVVLPGQVYDSIVSGTDLLDVNASQFAGDTVTSGAGGTLTLAAKGSMKVGVGDAEIGSATFRSDGITRIQSGLATAANVSAVETDTQDIQSRLPAALISGRIDATVGAMQTDVLTSTALAASAVTEIQSGLVLTSNLPSNFSTMLIAAAGTVTANPGGTLTVDLGTTDGTKLDEIHRIHGLKSGQDLVVTSTSRVAGSISQTIASGGGTTTVSR